MLTSDMMFTSLNQDVTIIIQGSGQYPSDAKYSGLTLASHPLISASDECH